MNKEPTIFISKSLEGSLTIFDLLLSTGGIAIAFDKPTFTTGGFIFAIDAFDFVFCLSIQNGSIYFQRNEYVTYLKISNLQKSNTVISIFANWLPNKLELHCDIHGTSEKSQAPSISIAPPAQLIRWARKNNLVPRESYKTEQEFRERIHQCFYTINQKIREADAYKSFWNINYSGQNIVNRKPKKEVEIQPLIHCILSDQMLISNIEIIPEHKTGAGNLDFLLLGQIDGVGFCRFCVEFKLAHSKDINHGLLEQLPKYMEVSNATYGAYCVLNFKCDWFNFPTYSPESSLDTNLFLITLGSGKPAHRNIRCFIIDLGKPPTASLT